VAEHITSQNTSREEQETSSGDFALRREMDIKRHLESKLRDCVAVQQTCCPLLYLLLVDWRQESSASNWMSYCQRQYVAAVSSHAIRHKR